MDLADVVNGPGTRAVREADQRLIDRTAAEGECPHEFLPTDANPTCGCWRPVDVEDLAA